MSHRFVRSGEDDAHILLTRSSIIWTYLKALQDKRENEFLIRAAAVGDEAFITLLFERGAEVNFKNKDGRTPLSFASQFGHAAVVRLLLKGGGEVNLKDKGGRTPLSYAAKNEHEAVVRLLLIKGAKASFEDEYSRTLLSFAVKNRHEAVVRLLLGKGAEVNFEDECGRTALWFVAVNGHGSIARRLLESGAEVNRKDKDGRTALFLAAAHGHEAIVRLLLENGAEVNFEDNDSWTPLSYATHGKYQMVVELLLAFGAKRGSKYNCDCWPFHSWLTCTTILCCGCWPITRSWILCFDTMDRFMHIRLHLLPLNKDKRPKAIVKSLFELWRLAILLFNMFYSIFFFEWPDGVRLLSTTMPWNIPPSLLVLWGVCWMFTSYEQDVRVPMSIGEGFMDIDSQDFMFNNELSRYDGCFDGAIVPGERWNSTSLSDSFSQDFSLYPQMFGDYSLDPGFMQPSHTTNTIIGDVSTNAVGNMHCGDNFLGNIIDTSEPFHVPPVELYTFSQASRTIQQYGNPPINGFQPQGEDHMTASYMLPALSALQILDSPFEPVLNKATTPARPSVSQPSPYQPSPYQPSPYQPSPSQPRSVNHHLEGSKQMRGDPTPNQQGQYICTYKVCAKMNRTFRLLCHWNKHMDTHERIYRCLQPECSKLKGFTYAGGLQRHEKHVHKMHGGVELYCPHATCSRAEGGGKPFTRIGNRADHLRRKHNNKVTTFGMANRSIAINPGMKRKRAISIPEIEASGETAILKATIEQLERRIEQLEESRVSRQLPEEEQ